MEKKPNITEAEWPIMKALWDRDSATAAEIIEAVARESDASMRTVKTLIRRLIAKGAVTYEVDSRDARIYHYRAALSRDEGMKAKNDSLLSLVYENRASDLLTHFVKEARLTAEEIAALRRLLAEKAGDGHE